MRATFANKALWVVKDAETPKVDRSSPLISTCHRPRMIRRTPWLVGRKAPIA